MDLQLKGKNVLIAGGSRGIGESCARIAAAEGANVAITYSSSSSRAESLAAELRVSTDCFSLHMNLGDTATIASSIESLRKRWHHIDALIICAGYNKVTPFPEISEAEWRLVMDINLNGPYFLLSACANFFGDGAAAVLVSSVAGHTGAPHHAHYAAAKAGLINLTKSAARELAPRVRVNCVAPGITLTEMGRDTASNLAPDYARTKLLAGRFAEPDEIARTIIFMASPASSFIYGATIDINGGRDLR